MSKNIKALWKFNMSYGRSFYHQSLFIATKEEVEDMYGKGLYFGEIAGKHSEVFFDSIDAEAFEFITSSALVISIFKEHDLETGHNPLEARQEYIDGMATNEEE